MYILRTEIGQAAGHLPWSIPWPCKDGGGRERERERKISAMAFATVITGEIFELICTYLHFRCTSSLPTYQGPSKFFKIYPLYVISTEYFDPCSYQTRTDESLILLCTGRLLIRQYIPLKL